MTPHVMHVTLTLSRGGTERLVVELVRRLGAAVVPAVCCLDTRGEWAADIEACGVPVAALGRQPGFRPALGRRIAALAVRHGANVLHCHHYSSFIYGRLASMWRHPLPVVFTEHGRLSGQQVSAKRRLVNTVAGRLSGAFCAVSEDLKRHMVAEGFRAHRVRVIHNGIDPTVAAPRVEARRTLGIAPGQFVVGTIARLDPVKDVPTLIEAFSLCHSRLPSAELVVIGDGTERADLEKRVRESVHGRHVRFIGARDDARTLLPAFDVYANSSITEGVSVTVLEAMAAGVPVVATRVGGTPEILTDRQDGRIVPPRNPQALADAITELAERPELAGQFASRARQRVQTTFSLDRMVRDYVSVYQAAVEGQH
jgi:glycosyltransferase involved in cell wall biosynthesis